MQKLVLIAVLGWACLWVDAGRAQEPEAKFALLVGIDKYENLSSAEQLEGSKNDVRLISRVLTARFGFSDRNIVTLLDDQATASSIREAFENLANQVEALPADGTKPVIYFHFSGHGSQVADQETGHVDRDEIDGLDETLVPYDADRQGGERDIRDDEINTFVERLVSAAGEKTASITLVYDCCHSGSGARGATKVRQLKRAMPATQPTDEIRRKVLPPGVVFLSACHETEVEPEFQENGKTYGLFTRFLAQVLSEHEVVSQLSNDLLVDAIRARYRRHSRVVLAPHPQLEASDIITSQLPILGATEAIDRAATYALRLDDSRSLTLAAGALHGLHPGAIFDVYESPEDVAVGQSAGVIELVRVEEQSSQARFVQIDPDTRALNETSTPQIQLDDAVAALRDGGTPGGTMNLKILKDTGASMPELASIEDLSPQLASQLQQMASGETRQPVNIIASDNESADLVLKVSGDQASLFPAHGSALLVTSGETDVPEFLRGGWGPFAADGLDDQGTGLSDYVARIAKAQNLVALASTPPRSVPADFDVDFQLLQVETNQEGRIVSSQEIPLTADQRLVLELGQTYAVRFSNRESSTVPVYCTAVEVTPDMGIQIVAPYMEREIKLSPGESYLCDPFVCDVPGSLYEILLVTAEPHNFSYIAQPDLPRIRGVDATGDASLHESLVGALFPNSAQTRGRRIPQKETRPDWLTRVIEWQVLPTELASRTKRSAESGTRTRGGPTDIGAALVNEGGVGQAVEQAESALTASQTDEGFELVKVFYGTDRKAIAAEDEPLGFRFPLLPVVASVLLVAALLWTKKNPTKLRSGITVVIGVATVGLSIQYVVSHRIRKEAFERIGLEYGSDRGELQVGTCEVSIPKDHRIGFIESPSILRLEFKEDPQKHVVLRQVVRTEYDRFFEQLGETIELSPRKEAIVFVHGYNVSFSDAARRTAQMAYDLKFQGVPIFFSWPSEAKITSYAVDENNVSWSVPDLKTFLTDIRQRTQVKSLNIIAHSMGNRAVTTVLKELHLEYQDEGRLFNQVILAAPDVDAEVFKEDIAPKIVQTASKVTLYASSKDRALVASKNIHGYPRAGESGENLVVVDQIDTIDVTEIDTSLLGHNYYGDSDSIVADIYELLHKSQPPSQRPRLKESFFNSLKYWIFLRLDTLNPASQDSESPDEVAPAAE